MESGWQELRNGLPLISTESSQRAFFQSVLLLFVSSNDLKRMINLHLDYRRICIRSILMLIHKLGVMELIKTFLAASYDSLAIVQSGTRALRCTQ